MVGKDWLLLFVPIICNGFLIFFFQTLVSYKISRNEKKNDFCIAVTNELSSKLCEEYKKILFLEREYTPNDYYQFKPKYSIDELWNPIAVLAAEIYDYAQMHEAVLSNKGISIESFSDSFESLVKAMGEHFYTKTTEYNTEALVKKSLETFKKSIIELNIKLESILLDV